MKTTSLKIAALGLALGLGVVMTPSVKADWTETTKGARLTVTQGEPLRTVDDFKSLRKGDKVAAYCPMMKETFVTTIRNVDSKGHAVIKETKKGFEIGDCNITIRKTGVGKETQTVMTCPDGRVLPVVCSKM